MLSHVMIGSNDIKGAKRFYNAVLGVLDVHTPIEDVNETGQTRLFYIHDGSTFCVSEPINGEPANPANGFTIGFRCESLEQVRELHEVAVANGATSVEGPPGQREISMGVLNLCYFLDPDGHKICGIHRER